MLVSIGSLESMTSDGTDGECHAPTMYFTFEGRSSDVMCYAIIITDIKVYYIIYCYRKMPQ